MSLFPQSADSAQRLRELLGDGSVLQVPGCFDSLSARILEASGFHAAFLGGFSVAAARLGLPDLGLLSYGEMMAQARDVTVATSLPLIGDADTGYGNAINAERALNSCARAGIACMMIEDQSWPKRCGHTAGKEVVDRREAVRRIRACVRAREDYGLDILIMARTDACAVQGFDEALWRCEAYADAGADITFLEAPEGIEQMATYCEVVPGWKTANLVEDGATPWLSPEQLTDLGYSAVLYPVSLLLSNVKAMQTAANDLIRNGAARNAGRARFDEVRQLLGWGAYEDRLTLLEDGASQ